MGMEVHVSGALSLLLLLLAAACTVEAQVFDVMKYGAAADEKTDISKAITDAWKEACAAAKPSTVLIPKGTYFCGAVNLEGPCKSSITLEVQGTVKAPADPAAFKGADGWFKVQHVDHFTLNGGGSFDGQGATAWKQNNCDRDANCKAAPMNFRFDFVNGGLVQDVTSLNSKNFHVNVLGCKDFTFKKFTVTAPATSLNTDGIHIGRSNGVNIIDTNIATGDDCISIGDGSAQVHITGVKCGPGHGISIGSLGKYPNEEPVTGIFVQSSTLTGTDNGLRIKSWPALYGGSATDLHFEDITMENVKNPILIDQTYCPYNQCNNKAPSKVKIKDVTFKKIKGTSATPTVVQLLCSNGIPCENVELTDITLTYSGPEGPAKSECANVKPTITGKIPEGC